MGPLQPNAAELVLGLVVFFLIFGILGKAVLPRIEKTLAAREDAIGGGMERAETARAEAQRIYEEYQAELQAARHEAARLRQAAAEEGTALIAVIRAEGQQQRDQLVAEAKVQLAADRIIAEAELREDVISVATELAGRVVGEPLAELPRTRAIADAFFAELDAKATAKS
ncbi:F0F1 ATP synthase subunit B family protein [Saccharothrix sp. ST-888]|uniref:F0F1 ATP synthase subunit B family protein n=1 Tax=Saccharothrix sp. ST-888 TaxID=1427391 RepID=UPI0005ED3E1B|nr:ATP synthase F0 subunit B [Saccharothrix sp. ST-888]KJK58490.1 ATP synthase F0 subunit B [Saccharothrix sp. ST-888]